MTPLPPVDARPRDGATGNGRPDMLMIGETLEEIMQIYELFEDQESS